MTGSCPAWNSSVDYSNVFKVGGTEVPIDVNQSEQEVYITNISYPGAGNSVKDMYALGSCSSTPVTGPQEILVVNPAYPSNGVNWNDYVKVDTTGKVYEHNDIACNPADVGYFSCVNGGEIKHIDLPAVETSCANISVSDALGAFHWQCKDGAGEVDIYSVGLLEGKGLSDLISPTGWKNNHVNVYKSGTLTYTSPDQVWWSNAIEELPNNSASPRETLSDAGKIYYIDSDRSSRGYLIMADKISITMLNGAKLTQVDELNCNESSGPTTVGTGGDYCLITTQGADFLWLEGHLIGSATMDRFGLFLTSAKHTRINNLTLFGFDKAYLFDDAKFSYFTNINSADANYSGIYFQNVSTDNIVNKARISGTGHALITNGANDDNIFHKFMSYSNANTGLYLISSGNTVTQSVFAHNGIGLDPTTSTTTGGTYSHILTAFNNNQGIQLSNADDTHINSLVSYGNGGDGIEVGVNTDRAIFHNVVSTNNFGYGFNLSNSSTASEFHGYMGEGNNSTGACYVPATPGNVLGLQDVTCTDGGDGDGANTNNSSTAVLRASRDLSASFQEQLTVDDIANPDDFNGSASMVFDWLNFDNNWRTWGVPSLYGSCTGSGCHIYDWRLAGAGVIDNRSGDLVNDNGTFTPGLACPAAVNGSEAMTDDQGNTFLFHAIEFVGDYVGDEDGLCESDERCLYAPNPGAFQGEGQIDAMPCIFDDNMGGDPVTNVQMFGY